LALPPQVLLLWSQLLPVSKLLWAPPLLLLLLLLAAW
jgi:hypothetical protein